MVITMEHPTEKYLTVKQVMERLQTSRDSVIRLIVLGELRAKKMGRQWRISEEWLRAYMNDEPQQEEKQ